MAKRVSPKSKTPRAQTKASSASASLRRGHLLVEIDGPNVSPTNVDAVSALALASAYIQLITKVAADEGLDLTFSGLAIWDKCAAIGVKPSDRSAALACAKTATAWIVGQREPPHGCVDLVRAVKSAIRSLPVDQHARVLAGSWKRPLSLNRKIAKREPAEILSVRATPIRLGGTRPAARFESRSEEKQFSLEITREVARELGKYLYRPIDIVARVERDSDGNIEYGVLQEYHAVSEDDPTVAWREWFHDHAAEWNSVDNVEARLGRSVN